jgi:hypothetical protein
VSEIWSQMYSGLHVGYPLFLTDFSQTWIFSTDFRKIFNINFHEQRSIGSRVFPCEHSDEQTDRQIDRRTDMTKLIAASHNSANAPKRKPTVIHMIIKFASFLGFLVFITTLTKVCCFSNMAHVNFLLSTLFSDTFKLRSFLRLEDFFYKVYALNKLN